MCLVVSMNWKHLVEPATALAEGAEGQASEVMYK